MNRKEYAEYEEAVKASLEDLKFVSSGPCPGCSECPELSLAQYWPEAAAAVKFLEDQGIDLEAIEAELQRLLETDVPSEWYDAAGEAHFSHQPCDICGSGLGGDRYPIHGRDKDDAIVHLDACPDCYYYTEYGQLDDTSMDEIEHSV